MNTHLEKHDPKLLLQLKHFKEDSPDSLRLAGTWFTGMAIIGNLKINKNKEKNHNHPHKDRNDMCSIFLQLGINVIGGETLYFDHSGENIVHKEQFEHGKFQVGPFDQSIHGANYWTEGCRGVISLYTNRLIYDHLDTFDTDVFDRWNVNSGEKNKKDLVELDKKRSRKEKGGRRLYLAKKGVVTSIYMDMKSTTVTLEVVYMMQF